MLVPSRSRSLTFLITVFFAVLSLQHQQTVLVQASSSGGATSASNSNKLPRSVSSSSSSSSSAIPRSHNNHRRRITEQDPPWNSSPRIDDAGFLTGLYERVPGEWEEEVRNLRALASQDCHARIRQVPGDGNCLFHSISLSLDHAVNGTHRNLTVDNIHQLYAQSQQLRADAVACLRQRHRRLFLQGRENLKANELVSAAAQQYGLTADEYCASMQQDCVWGGGPEIVALSNLLQRPIHVYELAIQQQRPPGTAPAFCLRRMACFGSPKFDRRTALHILSADSRFPDVTPGNQLAAGNHFLAVFPQQLKRRVPNTHRKRRKLRGGADDDDDTAAAAEIRSRWPRPGEDSVQASHASSWGHWYKSVLRRIVAYP